MATETERDGRPQDPAADRTMSDPEAVGADETEQRTAGVLAGRHARHPWSHRLTEAGTGTGSS